MGAGLRTTRARPAGTRVRSGTVGTVEAGLRRTCVCDASVSQTHCFPCQSKVTFSGRERSVLGSRKMTSTADLVGKVGGTVGRHCPTGVTRIENTRDPLPCRRHSYHGVDLECQQIDIDRPLCPCTSRTGQGSGPVIDAFSAVSLRGDDGFREARHRRGTGRFQRAPEVWRERCANVQFIHDRPMSSAGRAGDTGAPGHPRMPQCHVMTAARPACAKSRCSTTRVRVPVGTVPRPASGPLALRSRKNLTAHQAPRAVLYVTWLSRVGP